MVDDRHSSQPVLQSGGLNLATHVVDGMSPAVLWLGGFRSDMTGGKAEHLAAWGQEAGHKVVRFDYRGHGASPGKFQDFAISDWLADAAAVDDALCPDDTIAVGSSMGGWIALLLARQRLAAGRPFAGLVLIAPAADFTERLMWPSLPEDMQAQILRDGMAHLPSDYGEPYPLTRRLFEDGRQHLLYDTGPIETGCPIQILQGVQDEPVPHTHTLELMEHLATDDVTLTLIKDGDHRLSREVDLARLISAVKAVMRAGQP